VLDSGCGTGNYTVEFANKYGLKSVHCSDYSDAMVGEAKKNVETLVTATGTDGITFSTDNVCDMPAIGTGEFDAVINNQVVHHLRPDNDFEDLAKACGEWHRVLKPGGRISINFSAPFGQRTGMWWAELIPEAQGIWEKRSPTPETMKKCLEKAGFKPEDIRFEAILDEILYDPAVYHDIEGQFLGNVEHFRRSDSTFALVSDEEMKRAVARVQAMKDDGTLGAWMERKEWERKQVGQTMCCFAVKR